MDKNVSPSYSSSRITYVEAEAEPFSRFHFHKKGPLPPLPLPASASTSLVAIYVWLVFAFSYPVRMQNEYSDMSRLCSRCGKVAKFNVFKLGINAMSIFPVF